MAEEPGSRLGRHVRAAVTAAREAVRRYREIVALEGAQTGFDDVLAKATVIEGYTSPVELALLYHLAVAAPGRGSVVEIGSYLGRSSIVLAEACRRVNSGALVAVDSHTAALGYHDRPPRDTRQEFLDNVTEAGLAEQVRLVHMDSAEAGRAWDDGPVRMLFIDGWHSTEAVLADATSWSPHCAPDCCWVFDDYADSRVRAAVRRLVAEGVVGGDSAVVGKMVAFAPPAALEDAPLPPGGRALARLEDRWLSLAFRYAG
jgi:predicted O-methyltransferase YrrM